MSVTAIKEKKEERPNFVRRTNRTGIPLQLKERMEQNTGVSFDDVRVHYNSTLPAKLDALAYTKGSQVEIGPGQERHLPHELGHVVQQKLGMVRANARHASGVTLNTDAGLERQADEIGAGKRVALIQRRKENVVQRCLEESAPEEEESDGLQDAFVKGTETRVYRGGNKFKARVGKDVEMHPETEGTIIPNKGVSVNTDPGEIRRMLGQNTRRLKIFLVEKISKKLTIIPTGSTGTHCEIVSEKPMLLSDYQEALNLTECSEYK